MDNHPIELYAEKVVRQKLAKEWGINKVYKIYAGILLFSEAKNVGDAAHPV